MRSFISISSLQWVRLVQKAWSLSWFHDSWLDRLPKCLRKYMTHHFTTLSARCLCSFLLSPTYVEFCHIHHIFRFNGKVVILSRGFNLHFCNYQWNEHFLLFLFLVCLYQMVFVLWRYPYKLEKCTFSFNSDYEYVLHYFVFLFLSFCSLLSLIFFVSWSQVTLLNYYITLH